MDSKEHNLLLTQAGTNVKNPPVAWRVWLKTARPFSLTAAVSPVLVGTAVAAYDGTFHLVSFLAALFSGVFLQIGANYFNEYFDYRYGLDHPESLGSMTVIFRHEMTAAQVLGGGIASFVIAALFGFGGIAAGAVEIAKILFFIFAIIAIVTFILSLIKKN